MLAVSYDSAVAAGNTKFCVGDTTTPMTQLGTDQTMVQLTVEAASALFGIGYTDAAPAADTSVTGWQDDVRVYNTALDLAALDAVRLENLGGSPVLAADFNGDTKVDAADFGVWKTNFGTTAGAGKPQGNADADMDVDGEDFLIWQGEAGTGVPTPTAGSVPEPAGCVLASLAAAALAAMRRSARDMAAIVD